MELVLARSLIQCGSFRSERWDGWGVGKGVGERCYCRCGASYESKNGGLVGSRIEEIVASKKVVYILKYGPTGKRKLCPFRLLAACRFSVWSSLLSISLCVKTGERWWRWGGYVMVRWMRIARELHHFKWGSLKKSSIKWLTPSCFIQWFSRLCINDYRNGFMLKLATGGHGNRRLILVRVTSMYLHAVKLVKETVYTCR